MAAERVPEGQAAPREGSNPGTSGSTSALPAIVIVSRDATARRDLRRELSKRYGADYQLVVCDEPTELATAIRKVKDTGAQIALVIGGLGGGGPGGGGTPPPGRPAPAPAPRGGAVPHRGFS